MNRTLAIRAGVVALLVAGVSLGGLAPDLSLTVPAAHAAPWHPDESTAVERAPARTTPTRRPPGIRALSRRVAAMQAVVGRHEQTAARLSRWLRCVHPLPVDRVGDPGHGWGFEYDERDGTGLDTRTALVEHRGSERPDLLLLRFGREHGCLTRAPDPQGTGADARTPAPPAAPAAASRRARPIPYAAWSAAPPACWLGSIGWSGRSTGSTRGSRV